MELPLKLKPTNNWQYHPSQTRHYFNPLNLNSHDNRFRLKSLSTSSTAIPTMKYHRNHKYTHNDYDYDFYNHNIDTDPQQLLPKHKIRNYNNEISNSNPNPNNWARKNNRFEFKREFSTKILCKQRKRDNFSYLLSNVNTMAITDHIGSSISCMNSISDFDHHSDSTFNSSKTMQKTHEQIKNEMSEYQTVNQNDDDDDDNLDKHFKYKHCSRLRSRLQNQNPNKNAELKFIFKNQFGSENSRKEKEAERAEGKVKLDNYFLHQEQQNRREIRRNDNEPLLSLARDKTYYKSLHSDNDNTIHVDTEINNDYEIFKGQGHYRLTTKAPCLQLSRQNSRQNLSLKHLPDSHYPEKETLCSNSLNTSSVQFYFVRNRNRKPVTSKSDGKNTTDVVDINANSNVNNNNSFQNDFTNFDLGLDPNLDSDRDHFDTNIAKRFRYDSIPPTVGQGKVPIQPEIPKQYSESEEVTFLTESCSKIFPVTPPLSTLLYQTPSNHDQNQNQKAFKLYESEPKPIELNPNPQLEYYPQFFSIPPFPSVTVEQEQKTPSIPPQTPYHNQSLANPNPHQFKFDIKSYGLTSTRSKTRVRSNPRALSSSSSHTETNNLNVEADPGSSSRDCDYSKSFVASKSPKFEKPAPANADTYSYLPKIGCLDQNQKHDENETQLLPPPRPHRRMSRNHKYCMSSTYPLPPSLKKPPSLKRKCQFNVNPPKNITGSISTSKKLKSNEANNYPWPLSLLPPEMLKSMGYPPPGSSQYSNISNLFNNSGTQPKPLILFGSPFYSPVPVNPNSPIPNLPPTQAPLQLNQIQSQKQGDTPKSWPWPWSQSPPSPPCSLTPCNNNTTHPYHPYQHQQAQNINPLLKQQQQIKQVEPNAVTATTTTKRDKTNRNFGKGIKSSSETSFSTNDNKNPLLLNNSNYPYFNGYEPARFQGQVPHNLYPQSPYPYPLPPYEFQGPNTNASNLNNGSWGINWSQCQGPGQSYLPVQLYPITLPYNNNISCEEKCKLERERRERRNRRRLNHEINRNRIQDSVKRLSVPVTRGQGSKDSDDSSNSSSSSGSTKQKSQWENPFLQDMPEKIGCTYVPTDCCCRENENQNEN